MKKWIHCCCVRLVGLAMISLMLTSCGTSAQIQREVGPVSKHQVKGYENCFSCHSVGAGGAPKYPANHSGRTNDQCRTCHDIK